MLPTQKALSLFLSFPPFISFPLPPTAFFPPLSEIEESPGTRGPLQKTECAIWVEGLELEQKGLGTARLLKLDDAGRIVTNSQSYVLRCPISVGLVSSFFLGAGQCFQRFSGPSWPLLV